MRLQQTDTKALYQEMEQLYLEAFPEYERKPFRLMQRTQAKGKSDIWSLMDGDTFVGMAITMHDGDLVLLDYFAIKPEIRGGGYGAKALQLLYDQYKGKKFFLEIESTKVACDNLKQRESRKGFYLRNGLQETGVGALLFGTEMEILSNADLTFAEYRRVYERIYWPMRPFMSRLVREL